MAVNDPIKIGSDLLLVHEGTADLHVLAQLVRHWSIAGFQFLPLNGQGKMRPFFKGLGSSPHFKSAVPGYNNPVRALAVVLDAEGDAAATFQRVRDALLAASLPAPDSPGNIAEGTLRVGIFLVPDNQTPGKIETICLRSVENDPAWSCLESFFQCVLDQGGTLPAAIHMDKARAQAFLTTRPQPDLPVGLAALEGYWNFDSPTFAPLAAFLRELAAPLQ